MFGDGKNNHDIPSFITVVTEIEKDYDDRQQPVDDGDDDAVLDVLHKLAMLQSEAASSPPVAVTPSSCDEDACNVDNQNNNYKANVKRPPLAKVKGAETAGSGNNIDLNDDPGELTLTRGAPLSVVDQPGAYHQSRGGDFVRLTKIRSSTITTIHRSLSALSGSRTNGTCTAETNQDSASSSDNNAPGRPPCRSGSGSDILLMAMMEHESGTRPFQVRRLPSSAGAEESAGAGHLVEASPVEESASRDIEIGLALQVANPVASKEGASTHRLGKDENWILKSAKRRWLTSIVVVILVGASIVAVSVFRGSRNKPTEPSNMTFPSSNTSSSATAGTTTTTATATTIEWVVKNLPNYTQQAILDNPLSPQGLAYDWLRKDPQLDLYSDARKRQRFALATFYFATNGPQWYARGHDSEEWLSYYSAPKATATAATTTTRNRTNNTHEMNSLEQSFDECLWFSKVEMDATGIPPESINTIKIYDFPCNDQMEFISVSLTDNNLEGMLPLEIELLTTLEQLRVAGNKVSGTLPSSMFSTMTNLHGLGFRQNDFSGTIPSEIGLATNIARIMLVANQFDGDIPTEMFHLPRLRVVNIESNYFSGTVPSEVGLVTGLLELGLTGNQLTGTVPSQLGLLSHLKLLTLESNRFTGSLPSELARLEQLSELTVSNNAGITGIVPTFLGQISKLLKLDLGECDFTGEVPSELGNIQNLTSLHLGGNPGITGTIPSEVAKLPALDFLNISGTSLAGTLPGTLCGINDLYFDCSDFLCGCECPCF